MQESYQALGLPTVLYFFLFLFLVPHYGHRQVFYQSSINSWTSSLQTLLKCSFQMVCPHDERYLSRCDRCFTDKTDGSVMDLKPSTIYKENCHECYGTELTRFFSYCKCLPSVAFSFLGLSVIQKQISHIFLSWTDNSFA